MRTLFEEYFYHDVSIHGIEYNFTENVEESNKISFSLSNIEDENGNEIEGIITCTFTDIFYASSTMMLNFAGDLAIMLAEIDNNNDFFTEYKKNRKMSFLSDGQSDSLKCYVIYTNFGNIKIISSNDVQVSL